MGPDQQTRPAPLRKGDWITEQGHSALPNSFGLRTDSLQSLHYLARCQSHGDYFARIYSRSSLTLLFLNPFYGQKPQLTQVSERPCVL